MAGGTDFTIVPMGDASLSVRFEPVVDAAVNARAVTVGNRVRALRHEGVRDVVTAYHTVTVHFDPRRTHPDTLSRAVADAAAGTGHEHVADRSPIQVPVCYGGEFGPDIGEVAAHAGLSEAEVITLHARQPYRVYMLGFVPGFTYMGSVDPRIAMPRRTSPRLRVPVGSVGIANQQTGIYPAETPGGWQIVGRTPLRPFDPGRTSPFLLQAGDIVQFVPIDQNEFARVVQG